MVATVSIVGAGGRVGSTAAFVLQLAGIAQQLNLIDVVEGNVLDVVRGEALDLVHGYAFAGGPTVGNAPGSKWSAWNAITEFDQHHRPVRTRDPRLALERRFARALEDTDGLQRRAFALVAAA